MQELADAIRKVTARMQQMLEKGERPAKIDAHDLIEVLLAIAEAVDPEFGGSGPDARE